MIAVEDLTVRAGTFTLQRVSFALAAGEYGVLMGRTGSGKTTLLEALCGLKPVAAGRVRLLGREVTHVRPADRGIGYVPQDRALFPTLTVRDHLAFGPVVRRWRQADVDRRVEELAELLGLQALLARKPQGLSGGEAQRVALGRALAVRPPILLLDEPLSALDETTRDEMHELLRRVRRQTAVTTLHVTHSGAEAKRLADRILVLHDGAVRDLPAGREPHAAGQPPDVPVQAEQPPHGVRRPSIQPLPEGAS